MAGLNDLTTAIGRKQVAVEPDRNHAALEQIVDFKRGHRAVCLRRTNDPE